VPARSAGARVAPLAVRAVVGARTPADVVAAGHVHASRAVLADVQHARVEVGARLAVVALLTLAPERHARRVHAASLVLARVPVAQVELVAPRAVVADGARAPEDRVRYEDASALRGARRRHARVVAGARAPVVARLTDALELLLAGARRQAATAVLAVDESARVEVLARVAIVTGRAAARETAGCHVGARGGVHARRRTVDDKEYTRFRAKLHRVDRDREEHNC